MRNQGLFEQLAGWCLLTIVCILMGACIVTFTRYITTDKKKAEPTLLSRLVVAAEKMADAEQRQVNNEPKAQINY